MPHRQHWLWRGTWRVRKARVFIKKPIMCEPLPAFTTLRPYQSTRLPKGLFTNSSLQIILMTNKGPSQLSWWQFILEAQLNLIGKSPGPSLSPLRIFSVLMIDPRWLLSHVCPLPLNIHFPSDVLIVLTPCMLLWDVVLPVPSRYSYSQWVRSDLPRSRSLTAIFTFWQTRRQLIHLSAVRYQWSGWQSASAAS